MNLLFSHLSQEYLFLLIYGLIALTLLVLLLLRLPRKKSHFRDEEREDRLLEILHSDPIPLDPYQLLGIRRGANREEIVDAFRKKMKLYHPDRVGHLGESEKKMALERSIQLIRAKEFLLEQIEEK